MAAPVQVRPARVRVPFWLAIAGWMARTTGRAMWWVLRRPRRAARLGAAGFVAWMTARYGPVVLVGAVLGLGVGLGLWAWKRPHSFRCRVTWRLRGRWRRRVLMRRWRDVIAGCGLSGKDDDGTRVMPVPGPVVSSPHRDRFLVPMAAGHTIADWNEHAEALAVGLDAHACRIRTPQQPNRRFRRKVPRRIVSVELVRTDVLAEHVSPFAATATPNLRGLPVAVTEDATAYRLRLLGTHLLIAGETGSGKGSVIWSIIRQVKPGIDSGLVRLIGIDPKRVELPMGAGLFHELNVNTDDIAAGLERLVKISEQRQQVMQGEKRLHTPTVDEPFYLVIIDEILALTQFADNPTRKRVDAALGVLLTQGRSQAITIVGATQDVSKDVLKWRHLFPHRLALRLAESIHVDMALGDGMRGAGALCDLIPDDMPGTAYAALDGLREPVRIRFPFTTDAEIQAMSASVTVPAPAEAHVIEVDFARNGDSPGTQATGQRTGDTTTETQR
ncbi:MAG TPA: FtsK/SpoIIIE domain-containing protein [Nocardioidaceae bacterium]|nr:FtsK/SpoIIIE domain-containing protein [Nocardioidaceae bacterium]